jgi:hypothetical protein
MMRRHLVTQALKRVLSFFIKGVSGIDGNLVSPILALWLIAGITMGANAALEKSDQLSGTQADIDRMIDTYRRAPAVEKHLLLEKLRKKIVSEVQGQQKMAIVEAIRLNKLKIESRRQKAVALRTTRSAKPSRRSSRKRHLRCHGLECILLKVKHAMRTFFRQATKKRVQPAKKASPADVLKGKLN